MESIFEERIQIDYHDFSNIDMSIEKRKKMNIGDIWLNKAKCKKCNEIIQSNSLHDLKRCKCGNLSVDGGSWYLKRSVKNSNSFEEMSVNFNKLEKQAN